MGTRKDRRGGRGPSTSPAPISPLYSLPCYLSASELIELTHLWLQEEAQNSSMAHHSIASGGRHDWFREKCMANQSRLKPIYHNFFPQWSGQERACYVTLQKSQEPPLGEGLLRGNPKERKSRCKSRKKFRKYCLSTLTTPYLKPHPQSTTIGLLNYISQ